MRFVIDASAALYAFTSPFGSQVFDGHEVVGPQLLWSEFTSVLHASLRRGEVTRLTADTAMTLVDTLVRRDAEAGLHRQAWALAERLGWGRTYDAEYVALAVGRSLPLLTLDARLARGAGHTVQVITFADLSL